MDEKTYFVHKADMAKGDYVDVVKLIKCKDCIYYKDDMLCLYKHPPVSPEGYCYIVKKVGESNGR